MWPVSIDCINHSKNNHRKNPPHKESAFIEKAISQLLNRLHFHVQARLSGNPAWSIDGFRAIANPAGVSHATDFLSRVSKKAGFIVWLKKRAGKDGQMLTIFWEDEKHWLNIKNSIIITSHK